ncbi:trace amine-associated receptor 1-like [Lates calcarifer]|nr:trace amine-associated receptor 1-like [Lates calcarifer]
MAPEVTDNRTDEIHPCYQIDKVSNTLIHTRSAICVFLNIFLGSLSVVTVGGNLLVIISIIYFKQLHTPTNYLILSLAVADLLVGVLVFPLTIEFSETICLYHTDLFCKMQGSFGISLSISSILTLCCISIDRYYAVCQPLTYRTKINDNVVVTMILVTWGMSVIIGLFFITAEIDTENCGETCFFEIVIVNIISMIFMFGLPMIIMLCIYLKIFLVAQRQACSIHNTTKSGAAISKTERKATKTLAIVMGIYLVCWFPFFLCSSIYFFSHFNPPLPLVEFLNWLALSNSTFNPFIYAFFYTWFRSAFRMIISGKIILGDFTNSKLF